MISLRVMSIERDPYSQIGIGYGRTEEADVAFTIPAAEFDDLAHRLATENAVAMHNITPDRAIQVKRRPAPG